MHPEALGGGVAAFNEAVERHVCPYLNQLGEAALQEMRTTYEQLEAGNYEALGQIAERLAAAIEQKSRLTTDPTVRPEAVSTMDTVSTPSEPVSTKHTMAAEHALRRPSPIERDEVLIQFQTAEPSAAEVAWTTTLPPEIPEILAHEQLLRSEAENTLVLTPVSILEPLHNSSAEPLAAVERSLPAPRPILSIEPVLTTAEAVPASNIVQLEEVLADTVHLQGMIANTEAAPERIVELSPPAEPETIAPDDLATLAALELSVPVLQAEEHISVLPQSYQPVESGEPRPEKAIEPPEQPLVSYEDFAAALQTLIDTGEPEPATAIESDPLAIPELVTNEATESQPQPVPAIAVTVAERLTELEPAQQADIAPLLQEMVSARTEIGLLDTLPTEADPEVVAAAEARLEAAVVSFFEAIGIEYKAVDVQEFIHLLQQMDIQAPLLAIDLTRAGTHEAKLQWSQLAQSLTDTEHNLRHLVGQLAFFCLEKASHAVSVPASIVGHLSDAA